MKDLNNLIFGKLKVICFNHASKEPVGKYFRTRNYWKCRCECGNISIIREDTLKNRKSCGCSNSRRLVFGESTKNALYKSHKNSANIRKLNFDLTKDQFLNLTSQNCHYCNKSPSSTYKTSKSRVGYYIYNGIDRKDNNIRYILENCVPCCSDCNYAKSNRSKEEFLDWIKSVYNFSIGQEWAK